MLTVCVSSVHDGAVTADECMLQGGVGVDGKASLTPTMGLKLHQEKSTELSNRYRFLPQIFQRIN